MASLEYYLTNVVNFWNGTNKYLPMVQTLAYWSGWVLFSCLLEIITFFRMFAQSILCPGNLSAFFNQESARKLSPNVLRHPLYIMN